MATKGEFIVVGAELCNHLASPFKAWTGCKTSPGCKGSQLRPHPMWQPLPRCACWDSTCASLASCFGNAGLAQCCVRPGGCSNYSGTYEPWSGRKRATQWEGIQTSRAPTHKFVIACVESMDQPQNRETIILCIRQDTVGQENTEYNML